MNSAINGMATKRGDVGIIERWKGIALVGGLAGMGGVEAAGKVWRREAPRSHKDR